MNCLRVRYFTKKLRPRRQLKKDHFSHGQRPYWKRTKSYMNFYNVYVGWLEIITFSDIFIGKPYGFGS